MTAPPPMPCPPVTEPAPRQCHWLIGHICAALAGTASFGLFTSIFDALKMSVSVAGMIMAVVNTVVMVQLLAIPLALLSLPATYLFHLVNRHLRLRNPLWFMGYGALVSIPLPLLFLMAWVTLMTAGLAHSPGPSTGGASSHSAGDMLFLLFPAPSGALGGLAYWWATRPRPTAD